MVQDCQLHFYQTLLLQILSLEGRRVVPYNFIKCDSCSILVIVSREDVLSSISTDGVSISWHRRNKPGTIISHVDSLSSVRYCHRAISNECYDAMCLIYLSHACGCCRSSQIG